MVEIMSHHHQYYVPSHQYIKKVFVTGTGQEVDVSEVIFKKILFGGDQLTATRGRSAKRARSNSLSSITRLDGLEPNASDFHVQLNLLDVSYLLLLGSVDKVHTTSVLGCMEVLLLHCFWWRTRYYVSVAKYDWTQECFI